MATCGVWCAQFGSSRASTLIRAPANSRETGHSGRLIYGGPEPVPVQPGDPSLHQQLRGDDGWGSVDFVEGDGGLNAQLLWRGVAFTKT